MEQNGSVIDNRVNDTERAIGPARGAITSRPRRTPRVDDNAEVERTVIAIEGYRNAVGYLPTRRELARILGLKSSASGQDRIDRAVRAGRLKMIDRDRARAYLLVEEQAAS